MQTNHRNTLARAAMLKFLVAQQVPRTLEEIHMQACKKLPRLAFSTIFRLARTLKDEGLIEKIDWRDRGARYELIRSHHHHIVCERCGRVQDLRDRDINLNLAKIARVSGFHLTTHTLELSGLCGLCKQRGN